MKRTIIYFAAIIAFVSITPALSETSTTANEPNTPVTLRQYLQHAALNNAGLKAAFENFKSAAEQIPQAHSQKALYDFDDSARKIKLYKNILTPKAEQLLAVSENAYRAGSIDFLSLIDAQRTLLAYQLTYERTLTDNSQKLALLEMLAGSTLSTTKGTIK